MEKYLNNIERFVWNSTKEEKRIGLLNGLSGSAIFYFNILQYNPIEYNDKIMHIFEKMNEIISSQEILPSMCTGFAGYGIALLTCRSTFDVDELYFNEIDNLLLDFLFDSVNDKNYDLLHGAMGISLYFIERYKTSKDKRFKKILNNYFNQLIHDLLYDFDNTVINRDIDGTSIYYFGNAHGISGLINHIIILSKLIKFKVIAIKEVLLKLIKFLEKFQTNDIFKFPNYYLIDEKKSIESRLAWCQGDLGIGNALINCGNFFKDSELKNKGINLINGAMSVSFDDTGIIDFGICHGSSGVLLQYYLFLQKLKIKDDEIISFWKQVIIKQTNNYTKFEAFSRGDFIKESNVLEGASGLALTLLTVDKKINLNWSTCLNIN